MPSSLSFEMRDAEDEAVAYSVESIQAGGADREIPWFAVVDRSVSLQGADV